MKKVKSLGHFAAKQVLSSPANRAQFAERYKGNLDSLAVRAVIEELANAADLDSLATVTKMKEVKYLIYDRNYIVHAQLSDFLAGAWKMTNHVVKSGKLTNYAQFEDVRKTYVQAVFQLHHDLIKRVQDKDQIIDKEIKDVLRSQVIETAGPELYDLIGSHPIIQERIEQGLKALAPRPSVWYEFSRQEKRKNAYQFPPQQWETIKELYQPIPLEELPT